MEKTKTKARTTSSELNKLVVTCISERLCFYLSSVLIDLFVLRNLPVHYAGKPSPPSRKDVTPSMDDRIKHKKVTGQMNRQTADPKTNTTIFFIFPTAHFLKVILANHKNGTFGFVQHLSEFFAETKEPFFASVLKQIDLKIIN